MKNDVDKVKQTDLANPNDILALAEELQAFVKKHKLMTNIQGNNYVGVEGWQYACSKIGVVPVVTSCNQIQTNNDEIKYSSIVELQRISNGQVVGRGIGICSGKEPNKRGFQEYAIASMSQTRATGKAARLVLGWLMRASGFQSTPAEEMSDIETDKTKEENKYTAYLKRCKVARKTLGDEKYYGVLNSYQYEHSNDIKSFAEFEKVLAELTKTRGK